ncbi:Hint domain-containing protein [uncultured Sulfitobacter sp.]|uniref:Hint domain-containing protein n=1 Tax=uncultured Sulfitobacter sp. TaxID=191468 RepID=UPI00261C6C0E|nr:Hint domain-containing protein [uncultured Sulfitobacter sp.]
MPDTLMGGIVINEILVDPNGTANFDTDGNGTANSTDEYIELYNASPSAIDISGLELWDDGVGLWFTFPPGTILAAGGHALVMSGVQTGGALPTGNAGDLFFDAGRASPLINNGGDNVVVYDPASDEYIAARFNGDPFDNPVTDYPGFSPTATQSGSGENFGNDIDGFSIQRDGDGAATFVNNEAPSPGTTNVCLTKGTTVSTPKGDIRVEALRAGDWINTLDHGPQPITWIFAFHRTAAEIAQDSRQGAIRIARGALGNGLPHRSLTVSRQHRMLVRSPIAARMFATAEILVHAKDLAGADGVTTAPVLDGFLFFHILLPRHEVIFANGAPTESLYLGPATLTSLSPNARKELDALPAAHKPDPTTGPEPARLLAKGAKVRQMVKRHQRNALALCGAGLIAA